MFCKYLAITDLETTGLDEDRHEIIQIAREVVDIQRRIRIEKFTDSWYVHPSRWENREAKAMAVNKLALHTLHSEGIPLDMALQMFSVGVDWSSTPLTAWGNDFEMKFLNAAFEEADRIIPYNFKSFDIRSFAFGEQVRRTGDQEYKGLADCAQSLGISVDPKRLHDAAYDVWLTSEIYLTLLERT